MNNYLFINATIITVDNDDRIIDNGFLAVRDGRIEALGRMDTLDDAPYAAYEKIECGTGYKRRVLLPGFIQTHTHTTQALGRGLADDVNLRVWTHERIWPYEAALTEDDAYVSATLSIAEMIRSGTTSFCEASGQSPTPSPTR